MRVMLDTNVLDVDVEMPEIMTPADFIERFVKP